MKNTEFRLMQITLGLKFFRHLTPRRKILKEITWAAVDRNNNECSSVSLSGQGWFQYKMFHSDSWHWMPTESYQLWIFFPNPPTFYTVNALLLSLPLTSLTLHTSCSLTLKCVLRKKGGWLGIEQSLVIECGLGGFRDRCHFVYTDIYIYIFILQYVFICAYI